MLFFQTMVKIFGVRIIHLAFLFPFSRIKKISEICFVHLMNGITAFLQSLTILQGFPKFNEPRKQRELP